MHTDGLILLAVDGALFVGIFISLVSIRTRLDRIEELMLSKKRRTRKRTVAEKKD